MAPVLDIDAGRSTSAGIGRVEVPTEEASLSSSSSSSSRQKASSPEEMQRFVWHICANGTQAQYGTNRDGHVILPGNKGSIPWENTEGRIDDVINAWFGSHTDQGLFIQTAPTEAHRIPMMKIIFDEMKKIFKDEALLKARLDKHPNFISLIRDPLKVVTALP